MHAPGFVPIQSDLYLAIRDFNPEDREKPIDRGVRFLAFRAGELVLITLGPNKAGWFEGYRFNDPERQCGLSNISALKKVNFK